MYKIAICDDNVEQTGITEKIILDFFATIDRKIEIDVFFKPETLLNTMSEQKNNYQLIFLDIEMQGINGIEVAKRLRALEKEFLLVFITGYDNYMLESFEVLPFRYVLKPIDSEKMEPVLQQLVLELDHHNQYLFYKIGKQHYQLRIRDIVVISSELGRKVKVELVNECETEFYFKLKELLKILPSSYFFQVNRGVIINLNYITGIIGDQITLINEKVVYISRRNRQDFKKAYTKFIERCTGI
ncbi:LytTR family DNA-binding domain-containing protein [Ligilactobacillus murinus]|uniref:LytR/AlgR family response regulator transcription factor n=1 Tax=Ligilactobacillus murinus TaxID=1622 RepID=UPI00296B1836|nr:LytTR family DNA-binding domain-containing protein [Ligilactobacillus murinus]WOY88895.1 LytTR family DNA-binding domain-containing protein [Ligilactobacillus murinus]